MITRRLLCLISVVLLGWVRTAAAAEPQLHEGTVITAAASKLMIKDRSGKDQSFAIDGATRITVNGKVARLEDLKENTRVQVMTDGQGKALTVATVDKEKRSPDHVF